MDGYEGWSPEFQDLWENMPVNFMDMSRAEYDMAQFFFEEGFQRYHGESSSADIEFAREQFFEIMGFGDDYFDWEGWREAMGYE